MPSVINQQISISPLAERPAHGDLLIDVSLLRREYYPRQPDLDHRNQRVSEIDVRRFNNDAHLRVIVDEGTQMVTNSFGS